MKLGDFPGLIIDPLLFTVVVYWIAGLRASWYAFSFTVVLAIIVLNVANACAPKLLVSIIMVGSLTLAADLLICAGSFFSCAFGSMPVAIAYLVPFDYTLMITSGLFVKLSTIPKFISWVRHLSWLMYSNEAMSILQWEGVQNITCTGTDPGEPCLSTGTEVLTQYDFEETNLWQDVIALTVLCLVFHLLAIFSLQYRTRRK